MHQPLRRVPDRTLSHRLRGALLQAGPNRRRFLTLSDLPANITDSRARAKKLVTSLAVAAFASDAWVSALISGTLGAS
jgi:hypothetical protein